ncbi:Carbohydrate-selective porin OprB [Noviherbaspirillum humi]|uniref:Carbohydrate-selective porin OprB n=1 Tax=Noviherbaspirillum humi TaxID=1688639 RepID=A0A239JYQ6_9BURK|nr:carbohydrate porin [Noviherbaspirillum humi]SNT11146.1 Carbohydrate-selective porin OprB [Noviherbaspirillum humi]
MPRVRNFLTLICRRAVPLLAGLPLCALAADADQENFQAHFQATYIWQAKPSFPAAYSGPKSLRSDRETSYSFSATAALGWRPWRNTELYFNPEVVQGVPLSGLSGLGGMSNGEQQKTSGPNPTFYRARLFLRQHWDLGGESEAVESDVNQLAGLVSRRRLTLTAGNFAVIDVFDNNVYAHDPRTQFLNWSLMANGAYDYAADARGFSWGAALEYFHDDWAFRAGRFMQPAESNGLPLDKRIFAHYGDQVEVEHGHRIGGQPGTVRLLAFRNRANMGGFRDALDAAALAGGAPDVADVRRERSKVGYGINAEQSLSPDVGMFARASWNDGKSETYAFTEIERSVSAGMVVKGASWRRPDDAVGIAFARNGLSRVHRDYLAAGGSGAFIGDGRLNYRPETIFEGYYSFAAARRVRLTLDFQRILNPAYNADRGPVSIASLRLHAEY